MMRHHGGLSPTLFERGEFSDADPDPRPVDDQHFVKIALALDRRV
jgi:hypothetical protein